MENEQLFVIFLQEKYGNKTIKFIKYLGGSVPKEYEDVRYYNF